MLHMGPAKVGDRSCSMKGKWLSLSEGGSISSYTFARRGWYSTHFLMFCPPADVVTRVLGRLIGQRRSFRSRLPATMASIRRKTPRCETPVLVFGCDGLRTWEAPSIFVVKVGKTGKPYQLPSPKLNTPYR